VTAFARLIEAPNTKPPLTIGIFGAWGSGKSFLLRGIESTLQARQVARARTAATDGTGTTSATDVVPVVHCVTFNAWEYNATERVWPGLVRKVMDALELELGRGTLARMHLSANVSRVLSRHRRKIIVYGIAIGLAIMATFLGARVSPQFLIGAFATLGVTGLIQIIREVAKDPVGKWLTALLDEPDYGRQIGYMQEIRDDLSLLDQKLSGRGRVLILIDDLDRCEPDKAVEVLQAINLLLNFGSFIVCVGVDARVTTRAIEKHYKDVLGPDGTMGYEYLDKIIQIPFSIPAPTKEDIERFLEAQLAPAEPIPVAEAAALPADDAASVAFTPDEESAFRELAPFVRRNPRHIKRLINVYRLVRSLAISRNEDRLISAPRATLAWLLLCAQWPYTAQAMLELCQQLGVDDDSSDRNGQAYAMSTLFEQVKLKLSPEAQRRFDGDPAMLERLIALVDYSITWGDLKLLGRYTINFNPAVYGELMMVPVLENVTASK
jgi:hypothetical protein